MGDVRDQSTLTQHILLASYSRLDRDNENPGSANSRFLDRHSWKQLNTPYGPEIAIILCKPSTIAISIINKAFPVSLS
jgi:hypothetical protein